MDFDLTQSIVRILQQDGTTAGTGFFVSKNGLIATCAHVISGYQPGEEVFVVLFSSKEKHKAIIEREWWRKPSDEDVAILRLLNTPSHDISAIPLGYPWHIENISLITFGFPKSKPVEGLSGKCEVIGRTTENGCPVLQMRSQEVTRGFSGAPVLNPVTNKIVGMITAIFKPDEYGKQAETTFVTPSDILANVCPEVEEINIERTIRDFKSERFLGDRFIELAGQSSTIEDIEKGRKKESSIVDQLGLDPDFSLMETSLEEDSRTNKKFSNIKDTENLSDGVIEELSKYARCILLGEAGAGKTTTLERIVLNAAEKRLATKEGVLPVHLKLSAWQADQSFLEFICGKWSFASDPFTSLENGNAALYLDGLNEIGSDTDTRIKQLREWISSKPESKRILLTCRKDDYLLSDFDLNIRIVKIESMEESRIRLFSKKYLDSTGKNSETFISQVLSPNLIKLASNPFMLTALIVAYADSESSGNALPKNKGLLSKQLVKTLWNRERKRNWSGWLPYNEMELMLSKLTFHMIDSNNSIEISVTEALKHCSFEILQILRSANIVRIENEKLKFYHQLMQEFFAAVELKRCELSKKLQQPQILGGQRKDSRWDQVVVALCGISEFPDDIVNHILKIQDPYLAAICISSGIQVREATIEETVNQLIGNIAVWEWSDFVKRSDVVRKSLSDIGKPAVPFLINFLESRNVVLIDRGNLAKGAIVAVGGTVVVVAAVVGVAAVIVAAPQIGGASLLGIIPFAKKLSENERFNTFVQAAKKLSENERLNAFAQNLRENSFTTMSLKMGLKQSSEKIAKVVPEKFAEIEIEPLRKIGLMKLIISTLGVIGDLEANSYLQKLSQNDPSEEVREAARLAIKKIKSKS